MPRSYQQNCPLAKGLDVLGERWTLLILRELIGGARRYGDLRAQLPGIATNLLADRLRELEAAGLVDREELPPPVARTVYTLSETGWRKVLPVVKAIAMFGLDMIVPDESALTPLNGFLAGILLAIDPAAVGDLTASYRIEIDNRRFEFAVDSGGLAAAQGPPDVTVTATAADVITARLGTTAAERKAALRRVKFDGDTAAVDAMRRVFALSGDPDCCRPSCASRRKRGPEHARGNGGTLRLLQPVEWLSGFRWVEDPPHKIDRGCARTSSTTIGIRRSSRTPGAVAVLMRSCFSAAGLACHSMLSYSATTIASGQAKSTRHRSPQRSTISYCSSGIGNPPSMNTNRASLSIGDSARPSACSISSRTLTMPRRPLLVADRRRRARPNGARADSARAASSVASARGRRSGLRATSTAVHAGAGGQPPVDAVAAVRRVRWCTVRPAVGPHTNTSGSSTWTADSRSPGIEARTAAAAVPMQATITLPVIKSSPASPPTAPGGLNEETPCHTRKIAPAFRWAASALRDITS